MVPTSIFKKIRNKLLFQKPKESPFYIFRHYATYQRLQKMKIFSENLFPHSGTVEENTSYFEALSLFLSLRYGADLGRSRLVSFYSYLQWSWKAFLS